MSSGRQSQQLPGSGGGTGAASSSSSTPSSSSSAGPLRPGLAGGPGLSRLGVPGGGSALVGRSGGSGPRKRPLPTPLCNGLINSYEDKSNDFVCPICFDMIEEAYMTKCGHSFCYKCIHQSLEDNNRCPKCNYVVDNIDHLYPNFLVSHLVFASLSVNELILKQKQRFDDKRLKLDPSNGHRWQILQDLLATDQDNLDLANVNLMLQLLVQKKRQLEAESHAAQVQILMEFLKVARRNKREQLEQIQKELGVVEEDLKRVEEMSGLYSPRSEDSTVPQFEAPSPSHSSIIDSTEYSQPPGFSGNSQTKKQPWYNSTLASRRKRLTAHFEDLEQCYFSARMARVTDDSRTVSQLDEFQECLSKFTRYNSVRPLATLSYASDLYNGSSIVSSIEFDRDCDYFAIAGVTKKIKVYEYGTVIQDAVDIHYPENEMTCNSKISCISWSSYHKNLLASSDYEGTVILWDGFTGQRSKVYQEHEKRCWSVDFNLMDPKLLASGSDDAKVKLWSTNLDNSVASIEAKANVCCVKFSPSSRYHLAFGCADHCVHYYDLRNTKQPIMVFKGHRKAVSYAKFVNGEEIVSASTDSQLKLWNVTRPHCLRSFKGHINEKNFVGLASNGDYIACGSENNSLYLYYKGLSKTLLTFKFDTVKSVLDKDRKEDDTNEFVSAVCWRALPDGESNVLIAANSQGTIKLSWKTTYFVSPLNLIAIPYRSANYKLKYDLEKTPLNLLALWIFQEDFSLTVYYPPIFQWGWNIISHCGQLEVFLKKRVVSADTDVSKKIVFCSFKKLHLASWEASLFKAFNIGLRILDSVKQARRPRQNIELGSHATGKHLTPHSNAKLNNIMRMEELMAKLKEFSNTLKMDGMDHVQRFSHSLNFLSIWSISFLYKALPDAEMIYFAPDLLHPSYSTLGVFDPAFDFLYCPSPHAAFVKSKKKAKQHLQSSIETKTE
ncbi:E3 ubiquitin-protein ligase COP1 [Gastrophryne carolinensis]